MSDSTLFEVNRDLKPRFEPLADGLPVLLIDEVFARPDDIRAYALGLPFEPPRHPYPGKIAQVREPNLSLDLFLRQMLDLVNGTYLPALPAERRIGQLSRLETNFAIVDVHPDDLESRQRIPHVDPVPIFGLAYLNREERGGTLFFKRVGRASQEPSPGYLAESRDGFEIAGRIEPLFNRLALYPGFVPHSGEIAGNWICSNDRFTSPRLTQRLLFA